MDLCKVGHVGEQPQGAVLHAHEDGPRPARAPVEPLAPSCRGHVARARTGTGEGLMRPFPRRPDEDFSEEVKAHLELETERLIADGLTPDAARAAARKAFGNVAAAEERFHESTRWVWLEQFANDLRYAARGLGRTPGFLLTTVLTIAVG